MNTPSIPKDHSLIAFAHNPMWLLNQMEARTLKSYILDQAPDNNDSKIHEISYRNASDRDMIKEILSLQRSHSEEHNLQIPLTLTRETTLREPSYIDEKGDAKPPLKNQEFFRYYFDGTFFPERKNLSHAVAVLIKPATKEVWFQDPQGVPMLTEVMDIFAEVFPDYDLKDFQIKQQYDAHSCYFITLYNLERFMAGNPPECRLDANALRKRYADILDTEDKKSELVVSLFMKAASKSPNPGMFDQLKGRDGNGSRIVSGSTYRMRYRPT